MTMKFSPLLVLILALSLTACGGDADSTSTASTTTASAPKVLLPADPGEAKGIFDVRKMKAGDEVVAVGRVQHIQKGFAALRLVDDELEWCGRGDNPMKDNTTPWAYCCADSKVFKAAILPVEIRKDGEVLETDDIGIRHLDLVVMKGKLEETEGGGLVLITNGWYRRDRPDFGDRVLEWP